MPLLAHASHWLVWVLYAIPVAIVLGAIVLNLWRERRERGGELDAPSDPG